jgi:branched-chain amino acid transport system substrate-binding protein
MHRSTTGRLVAVLLVLTFAAAACSSRDDTSSTSSGSNGKSGTSSDINTDNCTVDPTQPIKGDTIMLASSFPQSGLTAAFSEIAQGWKAYFNMQNKVNGGVKIKGKTYKIASVDADDEYNAAKTRQVITREVGNGSMDKAFATFQVVGTANNINIRGQLNDLCVPNLFAATGSTVWGNPDFPWTIGATNAPYTIEATAFASYLKKVKPDATVAILAQDDDFGQAYIDGFQKAAAGSKLRVVKTERYAAGAQDVGTQMTSLAATDADAFLSGSTLLACPDSLKQAKAKGWKPITYVSGTCASKTLMGLAASEGAGDGALTTSVLKDPLNAKWDNDKEMKDYYTNAAKYWTGDEKPDLKNGIIAYGWTQGALLVKALEAAKAPTRLAVLESVRHMNGVTAGLLRPGVTVTTNGVKDPYMTESVQFGKYKLDTADATKSLFEDMGSVENFEGKTKSVTPESLITGS